MGTTQRQLGRTAARQDGRAPANRMPRLFRHWTASPCGHASSLLLAACIACTPCPLFAESVADSSVERPPADSDTDCNDDSERPCDSKPRPPPRFQSPVLRGDFGEMTGNPMARFGFGHCHELENGELFCH